MARFRPAGLSDEDDSDEEFGFYERPSRVYNPTPQPNLRKKLENNLQDAILNGNLKEVEKIVICELNNDVNTRLETGWTPLIHACFHAQDKIVIFLLEKGADPNLHADSVTPMMVACSNSGASNDAIQNIVVHLLQRGCLINVGDKYGQTPLMRAISSGRVAVVQKLLEHGVNIEMRDQQGWTAIFWACHHNQPEVLEMLIAKGARLTEVDRSGRTPIDIAESHDYSHLIEMLNNVVELQEPFDNGSAAYVNVQLSTWHDYYPGINRDKPTYTAEIAHLLYGMSCERLTPQILESGMDLRSFLLIEDNDMLKLGIDMPYERRRLRQGLKNFHMKGWKLSAVAGLYARKSEDYSVLECLTTLGTHLHQVYILEATLQYNLREYNKIKNQVKFEPPDSPVVNNMKLASRKMLSNMNSIKKEINSMKNALIKISRNNSQPADLIKEKTNREIVIGYVSQAVLMGSLGIVVFYGKRYFTSLLQ